MNEFVMATKNKNKVNEMSRMLKPLGLSVVSENELLVDFPEVDENGTTFEENALLKARSACVVSGLPALADDSGLCVDALDGAPGIFSARYAGEPSDTKKNNEKLLRELNGVPSNQRTAKFVSAVACAFPDGREFTVRGECLGSIAFTASGNGGFGYDPLFLSEIGCFGELTDALKDSISHRGNALRKLVSVLPFYL